MAILNTSNQQLPYPDNNEYLKWVWQYIRNLALAVEKISVMRFATSSDLTSRVPSPEEGMLAYLLDSNTLQVYTGSSWARVYPPSPAVYTGTTTPASSLGATGDLYIQY
jgi:hypothetical protein